MMHLDRGAFFGEIGPLLQAWQDRSPQRKGARAQSPSRAALKLLAIVFKR